MARHAYQFLYGSDPDETLSYEADREPRRQDDRVRSIDANYMDMINYALFGLIKLEYGEETVEN